MPVDIAFITVNYNTLECVRRLAGFFKSLDAPFTFTFTVVDNDSRDGSQEFLQSRPEISYLQTGGNIGYGRAINRGVAATASKYVCAMNTDVILNREALIKLWRFLEERPDAGVCAPRITYEDGRNQGMVFKRSLFSHLCKLVCQGGGEILEAKNSESQRAVAGRWRVGRVFPDPEIRHTGAGAF